MPVESNYNGIWNLNPDWPEHTDALSRADSHMRGTKQSIQYTFSNIGGIVTADHDELNKLDGYVGDIPTEAQIQQALNDSSNALSASGINTQDISNIYDRLDGNEFCKRAVDGCGGGGSASPSTDWSMHPAIANVDMGVHSIVMDGGSVVGLPAVPPATGAASKEYVDSEIQSVIGDNEAQLIWHNQIAYTNTFTQPWVRYHSQQPEDENRGRTLFGFTVRVPGAGGGNYLFVQFANGPLTRLNVRLNGQGNAVFMSTNYDFFKRHPGGPPSHEDDIRIYYGQTSASAIQVGTTAKVFVDTENTYDPYDNPEV